MTVPITQIQRIDLLPGEVLIVTMPKKHWKDMERRQKIVDAVRETWPSNAFMVLPDTYRFAKINAVDLTADEVAKIQRPMAKEQVK